MTSPVGEPSRRSASTSRLAQSAAVLAVCCPPLGLALSIAALVHLRRRRQLRGRDLAIGGVVISLVWGLIGLITIPGFLKFQARTKQSECKSHLLALHAAASSEERAAGGGLAALGVSAPQPQRYAYYLAEPGEGGAPVHDVLLPPKTQVSADAYLRALEAARPESGGAYVACAGNIDSDETLDVWVLPRRDGRLVHRVDDVAD